jgi:hypothetical protein
VAIEESASSTAPEEPSEVDTLRIRGYLLWEKRRDRMNKAVPILFAACAWLGAGIYYKSPITTYSSMFVGLLGAVLYFDGMRLRLLAERVDAKIRRLEPEARLLPMLPEEYGQAVRAALNNGRV